jgi:shikimate dehydrogenase
MKRVALLGFPVSHSVSPAMHNAAFAALRMPWNYSAAEVSPGDLAEWIDRLRNVDWAGANVTVPHTIAAADLVDELSESARRIGAVNTIVNNDGRLIGHNTDVDGFTADLAAHKLDVAKRTAIILGAGGAARAVAHAMAALEAKLHLVCRNQEAGRDLVSRLASGADDARLYPWSPDGFSAAAEGAALIVNATPLGMAPRSDANPWPPDIPMPAAAFVYDLVFNPLETRLVAAARKSGLSACGGLGMLVEQGVRSFRLWTGSPAPLDVMTSAAAAALEKKDAQVSYGR